MDKKLNLQYEEDRAATLIEFSSTQVSFVTFIRSFQTSFRF